MNREARILEATYFDKADIIRKVKENNEETGVTEFKEKTMYNNIKCAISKGGQSIDNGDGVAITVNSYKLFCNPKYIPNVGDLIKVTFKNGLKAEFIASKPFFYISSCQVDLTEKERV